MGIRSSKAMRLACAALVATSLGTPAIAWAVDANTNVGSKTDTSDVQATEYQVIYRLYNPYSGEHFYTDDALECYELVRAGWIDEGTGWLAPLTSSTPVYRLYNPYTGDHHYTIASAERKALKKIGWSDEGVAWYSDDDKGVPLYRQFNPYVEVGAHNYTDSKEENDALVKVGWIGEGIAWYGVLGKETHISSTVYIMGDSEATQQQIVDHFNWCATYPCATYKSKGAGTIEQFVKILFEVAESEGVRADVVYAQAMLETNFLQFGGLVKADQCNFAGIGATGGGNSGNTFADVRTGLLAQVQHLKAYASTEKLNNKCVDPRFEYVERGCGPTLYLMGTKWAMSTTYGDELVDMLLEL